MALYNPNQNVQQITYNILLLGETGVGKSTFINSFVNYLNFDSMQNADTNEFISLIPSSFMITDENFQRKKVVFGTDKNESTDAGQSATQSCKSYTFPFENHSIRIIDSPGIGDTRGIDRDNINFENILAFLGQYEDLHAICILLKPNNPRLTVGFEYCIKQLLCHLEKSASNNILFIFTNSRQTFYKPGDTTVPLMELLSSIRKNPPHVDIAFNKDTVFCIDSEAFRFLVACINGVQFSDDDRDDFAQSWIKSAKECNRLIKRITGDEHTNGLVSHKVRNTVSINEARRRILLLQQPIGEVAQNIQDNLRALDRQTEDINKYFNDIEKLKYKLHIPIIDLKVTEFDKPRTVCTSSNCIDVIVVGDAQKYHYKTKCHDPCHLTDVQKGIIGDEALRKCAVMETKVINKFLFITTATDAVCNVCTCSYKLHAHIYYDTEPVTVTKKDENVSQEIKTKEDAQKAAESMKNDMEKRMGILNEEQRKITEIIAKFAHFLKNNAIAPYNDAFKEYLKHLIENEKVLLSKQRPGYISGLQNMLIDYEIEQKILENAMQSDASNISRVTAEDILRMTDELYDLEIIGEKLKELFQAQQRGRKIENHTFQEIIVKPKSGNWFKSAYKTAKGCIFGDSQPSNKSAISGYCSYKEYPHPSSNNK